MQRRDYVFLGIMIKMLLVILIAPVYTIRICALGLLTMLIVAGLEIFYAPFHEWMKKEFNLFNKT